MLGGSPVGVNGVLNEIGTKSNVKGIKPSNASRSLTLAAYSISMALHDPKL